MGQSMRDRSEVCPLPPGPLKDLTLYSRPNPILVAVSLTFILMTSGLVYYLMLPPPYTPPPPPPPPHAVIAIDGDANFSDTALLEGWPGDGSPENPFIIDGLDIVVDGGHLISISNTRVSFTISNCNLTGACVNTMYGTDGTGIYLNNVTNGELVNNICNSNWHGIRLKYSDYNTVENNTCLFNLNAIGLAFSSYNTVANNTCTSIDHGIGLGGGSDYNIVANNTCNSNRVIAIHLGFVGYNTVANNTCKYNGIGIHLSGSADNILENNICCNNSVGISLGESDHNTVVNNTCINNRGICIPPSWYGVVTPHPGGNDIGISLEESDSNFVVDNICNNNEIGIYLDDESEFNTVENNTFSGNTEHDIVDEWLAHREYVAKQFMWFLAGCGMILVVSVVAFVKFRRMGI